jgi:hypothetical protein
MPDENNQRDKDGAFGVLKWLIVAVIAIFVRELLK